MTDPLYPAELVHHVDGYPLRRDFAVEAVNDHIGKAVISHRHFEPNTRLACFTGIMQREVLQHTLQVTPGRHLYDPWFIGFLAHSFTPNVFLDMAAFEVWALRPIAPGETLCMDYSATEDVLYRQFIDQASGRIVHGRKEQPCPALLAQYALGESR